VVAGISLGIALGLFAGTKMPFVEPGHFGPNRLAAYLWPYVIQVLPNLLFAGVVFFSLGALLRRMLPVYVGGVTLFLGNLIASTLGRQLEHKTLAALLDPFGDRADGVITEYWTVAERNANLLPLRGVYLANRLLWLGVAAALLVVTMRRFRFREDTSSKRTRPKEEADAARGATSVPEARVSAGHPVRLLLRLVRLHFLETVKHVYFAVIVLGGVLFMIVAQTQAGELYGTNTYPVTYTMLELVGGSFGLFALIVIALYAGELTWRERDARMDQILDALPIPTWLQPASKILALIGVQALLCAVVMVCGIALQLGHGFFRVELGHYLEELFVLRLWDYALVCMLAIFLHALVQHKTVGHVLVVLYYLGMLFMSKLGLEHHLYKYGTAPGYEYSDMNGYGHFLRPVFWFDLYWGLCAVGLALVTNLLWVRGVSTGSRDRGAIAGQRLSPRLKAALGVTLLAFAATGGYIFYNTNVRNRYVTSHQHEVRTADYERKYKSIANAPQPRVVSVKVAIDIDPAAVALTARGTYGLTNKTDQPISTVYVNLPTEIDVRKLSVGAAARWSRVDVRVGFYTFDLPSPLQPGESADLEFDLGFVTRGFENQTADTSVVENGTFFSSGALPQIGYQEAGELGDDDSRKKYGLQPKPRMPDVGDLAARRNNYISSDADWVTFEATVATAPDQIALAPGYLEREWQEGGRRYFHYQMDQKILHFFSVLSARYQVRRDRWAEGGKDVALEIYYHQGHEYDLDAMMKGMKAALSYCTRAFGPYQHRQVRIIEFPRYQTFAQSFPNTIPYSEGVGFIAKVDPKDDEDIDYPFYITAHEVAHQWWAHQVIGGHVQGSTMLSETLAQYSALMVMKQAFGPEKMKRFLRFELDRYLSRRGFERKKELPLYRVEDQPYIHYEKGSLVMYALQDYLGEAVVNKVLAEYLAKVKNQEPPYTNSVELLDRLRAATPPELKYLITDLFETITLYDNRAISATYHEEGPGRVRVTVKIKVKKVRAGELGEEKETPVDDLVDVGVIDDKGVPFHLERVRVHAGEQEVTMLIDHVPKKAGVDPVNKLIDRKPDDNLVKVEKE
jgi:hypothetical protein